MLRRSIRRFPSAEETLFETNPRLFINLKSTLIKIIIVFLIIYFFSLILTVVASLQTYLVKIVQLPLGEITVIVFLVLIFALILWVVWDFLSWRSTKYILTNYRIIVKKGIISKTRTYIHYNKIQDITVSQTLIQRLFSCGNIEIFGGHEATRLFLRDIPNPARIERMINQMIELGTFKEPSKTKKIQKEPPRLFRDYRKFER